LRRHREQMVLASAPMWVRAKDLSRSSLRSLTATAGQRPRSLRSTTGSSPPDDRRRRNTGSERPAGSS
jgi:hypothetical protein